MLDEAAELSAWAEEGRDFAVATVVAEIVAARRGGTGVPLTGSGTPIHREAQERGAWRRPEYAAA